MIGLPRRSGPVRAGMLQYQSRHQTGQRCPCLRRQFRPSWRSHYDPEAIGAKQVELLRGVWQMAHPLDPAFRSPDRHGLLFDFWSREVRDTPETGTLDEAGVSFSACHSRSRNADKAAALT
jgi:hypothetical protein